MLTKVSRELVRDRCRYEESSQELAHLVLNLAELLLDILLCPRRKGRE